MGDDVPPESVAVPTKTSDEILNELFSSMAPEPEDGEVENNDSTSSPSQSDVVVRKKSKKAKKEKKEKKKKKKKDKKSRKSSVSPKRKAKPLSPPPSRQREREPPPSNLDEWIATSRRDNKRECSPRRPKNGRPHNQHYENNHCLDFSLPNFIHTRVYTMRSF